jgi:hypothetical protein
MFVPGGSAARLAAARDIKRIETFVPAAGEAAGPPFVPAIILRFA